MTEQIEIIPLDAIQPDSNNANKGSERGTYMLRRSLEKLGAGRSILLDKNGKIIAGNKTAESAADVGLDEVIVVRTKGNQLVAVMREDLDLDDPTGQARELAYADNRTGQVSLDWDAGVVLADLDAGVDLSDWFQGWELEALRQPGDDEWGDAFGRLPDEDRAPFQQMTFTLHDEQAEQVKAAITAAKGLGPFVDSPNENSNGNALARIAETFITEHGQG